MGLTPELTPDGLRLPFRTIGSSPVLAPVIPLSLKGADQEYLVLALIDSGAESSCLPYEFGTCWGST